MQFCHVSNRQDRQTHGSTEMNLFYSWSNFHFTIENKEIELEDVKIMTLIHIHYHCCTMLLDGC